MARVSTQDVLARNVGHESLGHFISVNPQHQFFRQYLHNFKMIDSDNEGLITAHFKPIQKNINEIINLYFTSSYYEYILERKPLTMILMPYR